MRGMSHERGSDMDRAIRVLLYATLLMVPLYFDTGLNRVFVLDKVVLLRLLVSAALSVWAAMAWMGKGSFGGRTPLDGPLLAFAGAAILATLLILGPMLRTHRLRGSWLLIGGPIYVLYILAILLFPPGGG